ncbi:replicase [Beihai mantis shrimp virus 2]|uniref:replicase n=1 Tax=Beihai mantis shrimp virus 2 TaxID=1922429 RepID=UPI00090C61D4|nr:replicase [Beihai mantis shrimp virus 2]APG77577.1 replicase [Beihai mantis shrimp virus 2]
MATQLAVSLYRANANLLQGPPAHLVQAVSNEITDAVDNTIRLPFAATKRDLQLLNSFNPTLQFSATPSTKETDYIVEHRIPKAYQEFAKVKLSNFRKDALEIGPDVTFAQPVHVCSVENYHNAARRNRSDKFHPICDNPKCDVQSDKLVATMVHDLSVDQAIDLMIQHGSKVFKLAFLAETPTAKKTIDSCSGTKIIRENGKVSYDLGANEHVYTHSEEALDSWVDCARIAALRGFHAECDLTFGLLKFFTISLALADSERFVPRRYAYTYPGFVRVPLPDIINLPNILNQVMFENETSIKSIINAMPCIYVKTWAFEQILQHMTSRSDKIWNRSNCVQYVRSIDFTTLYNDKADGHNDLGPAFNDFVEFIFILGSIIRAQHTKEIGNFISTLNTGFFGFVIRKLKYTLGLDIGQGTRISRRLQLFAKLVMYQDFLTVEETQTKGKVVMQSEICPHGIPIPFEPLEDLESEDWPCEGSVFVFGLKTNRVPESLKPTYFSPDISQTYTSTINHSINCDLCMSSYSYIITKNNLDLPGNLFLKGEGYQIPNTPFRFKDWMHPRMMKGNNVIAAIPYLAPLLSFNYLWTQASSKIPYITYKYKDDFLVRKCKDFLAFLTFKLAEYRGPRILEPLPEVRHSLGWHYLNYAHNVQQFCFKWLYPRNLYNWYMGNKVDIIFELDKFKQDGLKLKVPVYTHDPILPVKRFNILRLVEARPWVSLAAFATSAYILTRLVRSYGYFTRYVDDDEEYEDPGCECTPTKGLINPEDLGFFRRDVNSLYRPTAPPLPPVETPPNAPSEEPVTPSAPPLNEAPDSSKPETISGGFIAPPQPNSPPPEVPKPVKATPSPQYTQIKEEEPAPLPIFGAGGKKKSIASWAKFAQSNGIVDFKQKDLQDKSVTVEGEKVLTLAGLNIIQVDETKLELVRVKGDGSCMFSAIAACTGEDPVKLRGDTKGWGDISDLQRIGYTFRIKHKGVWGELKGQGRLVHLVFNDTQDHYDAMRAKVKVNKRILTLSDKITTPKYGGGLVTLPNSKSEIDNFMASNWTESFLFDKKYANEFKDFAREKTLISLNDIKDECCTTKFVILNELASLLATPGDVNLVNAHISHPRVRCYELEEAHTLSRTTKVLFFKCHFPGFVNSVSLVQEPVTTAGAFGENSVFGHNLGFYTLRAVEDAPKMQFAFDPEAAPKCCAHAKFLGFYFNVPTKYYEHVYDFFKNRDENTLPASLLNIKGMTLDSENCYLGESARRFKLYHGFAFTDSEQERQTGFKGRKVDTACSTHKVNFPKETVSAILKEFHDQCLNLTPPYENLHGEARANMPEADDVKTAFKVLQGPAGTGKSSQLRSRLGKDTIFVTPTNKLSCEYMKMGYVGVTPAKFVAKNFENRVVVIDEFPQTHFAIALIAALRNNQVYLIGDFYQNKYGSEEKKTRYPYDMFIRDPATIYVSFTVPEDVAIICRKDLGYPIRTMSDVKKSICLTNSLPESENNICFTKLTRQSQKDYFTSQQVQGSRFEECNIFIESNSAMLVKKLPATIRVALTRHTKRANIKCDCKELKQALFPLAGGALKNLHENVAGVLNTFEYADVIFDIKDNKQHITDLMSRANTEVTGVKKLSDDAILLSTPSPKLADHNGEKEVVIGAKFLIPSNLYNTVDLVLPIYDINRGVDYTDDERWTPYNVFDEKATSLETDCFCPAMMEEALSWYSRSSLPYDEGQFYLFHNNIYATNRDLVVKDPVMFFEEKEVIVRRLPTKLRGRPYVTGDYNQCLHTAAVRSRDPLKRIKLEDRERVVSRLFKTYTNYVKPIQASYDDTLASLASYLSRIAARGDTVKAAEAYEEDIYQFSTKVEYFQKIQTKKDAKTDSFLRFNGFETKAGQSICPEPKGVNHLTSPFVRALEDCVLKGVDPRIHLHFGKSVTDLRNKYASCNLGPGEFVFTDFTEFDTFHDEVSSELMRKIFTYHGIDPICIQLLEKHDEKWTLDGGSFRIKMTRHLKSGQPDTLLKNTLFSMCLNLTFLTFQGLQFAAFCGDDSVLRVDKFLDINYPEGIADKVKLEKGKVGSFVGFLLLDDVYLDLPRLLIGISNKNFQGGVDREILESIESYQLGMQDFANYFQNDLMIEKNLIAVELAYSLNEAKARIILNLITSFAYAPPQEILEHLVTFKTQAFTIRTDPDEAKDYCMAIRGAQKPKNLL